MAWAAGWNNGTKYRHNAYSIYKAVDKNKCEWEVKSGVYMEQG